MVRTWLKFAAVAALTSALCACLLHRLTISLVLVVLLAVIVLLLFGLPRLRELAPFSGKIAIGGQANPRPGCAQQSVHDDDLLCFEQELLRLVNEYRSNNLVSEVSLSAVLLADSRARSVRISTVWRIWTECLRERLQKRGHFESALELVSVRESSTPESVLQGWVRRRSFRLALLGGNFGDGAVGVVREAGTTRYAVTLLLAEKRAF